LWENRDSYSGITLYPKNDAKYAQAPFEAIAKEKFDLLVKGLHSLDFKAVKEDDDNTKLTEQAACVGGACALV
jgi:ribonucleoside-diphosphate reductase alpha chain